MNYTIIHFGREDGIHRKCVLLILSSEYAKGLLSCEAVFPRMVSASVRRTRTGVRNIIQVYAPDSSYLDEQYQYVQDLLQLKISAVQKGEELRIQGNFNATVGDEQHSSLPEVIEKFGLGRANEERTTTAAVLCHK